MIHMKPHCIILSASLVVALSHVASGQTLVSFNFNDQTSPTTALTASTVAPNITASLFAVSDGGPFTDNPLITGSPPDTPAVGETGSWNAASPTKYFAFTVTPQSGYQVTITGLSFDYRQTGAGALNFQIAIGSSSNVGSGIFLRDSAWHQAAPTITSTAFTSATEVRIYGYNGGSGSFGIDRVTITGSVSAIPEPSTYALIVGAAALGGTILWRRRQNKSVG